MRSKTTVTLALLLAATSPAVAQQDGYGAQAQAQAQVSICRTVPIKGDLVILSMYGGKGAPAPYAIDSDSNGAHAVSVTGTGSGKITLVLTAYESTVWDLSAIKDRVAGVMAYGNSPQAISGLPASIPATFMHILGNKDASTQRNCHVSQVYEGMYHIKEQAQQVREITGVQPRRWYGAYSPIAFNVDGGTLKAPVTPPVSSLRAGMHIDPNGLLPGNDGLEQLIEAGAIRRFSRQELDKWAAKGADLDMIAGPSLHIGHPGDKPLEYIGTTTSGYILLKSLQKVPAGLGGANSVVFVAPEGLGFPTNVGHSTVYRMTGYPGGMPPNKPSVAIDDRARQIIEADRRNRPELQPNLYVEWDSNGRVVKDGSVAQITPSDGLQGSPVHFDHVNPLLLKQNDEQSVQEPDASRDMTPTALLAALLLIGGGAGLILTRRRASPQDRPQAVDGPGMKASLTDVNQETPPEVEDEIKALTARLQDAMELTLDDTTALALLKFKRVVLQALRSPNYDEDLAIELDAIIERHLVVTVDAYTKAARRVSGGHRDVIEANLRASMGRLTGRLEEIMEEQSHRDADLVRQRGDFIRARHPKSGGMGELH